MQPVVSKRTHGAKQGQQRSREREEAERETVGPDSRGPAAKQPPSRQLDHLNEDLNKDEEANASQKLSPADQTVIEIARELYEQRPEAISSEEHAKEIFKYSNKGLLHCFSIVLLQEQERYNKLIKVLDHSLDQLIKAI